MTSFTFCKTGGSFLGVTLDDGVFGQLAFCKPIIARKGITLGSIDRQARGWDTPFVSFTCSAAKLEFAQVSSAPLHQLPPSAAMGSLTFALTLVALFAVAAVPAALGYPNRHLLQNRKHFPLCLTLPLFRPGCWLAHQSVCLESENTSSSQNRCRHSWPHECMPVALGAAHITQ